MTPATRKVERIVRSARAAGVASAAPDRARLRSLAGELKKLLGELQRDGGHPALQRRIIALHKLIIQVCDSASAPPPPKRPHSLPARGSVTRIVPLATGSPMWSADASSLYQRFPDESGDSVRTVSGGLPGLGNRG